MIMNNIYKFKIGMPKISANKIFIDWLIRIQLDTLWFHPTNKTLGSIFQIICQIIKSNCNILGK